MYCLMSRKAEIVLLACCNTKNIQSTNFKSIETGRKKTSTQDKKGIGT